MNTTVVPSSPAPRNHRLARSFKAALLLPLLPVLLSSCTEAEAAETDEIAALATRVDELESKEELRSVLMGFAKIVDNADIGALSNMGPRIAADFTMDVIDFDGHDFHFEGVDGLLDEYGPIMVSAQANLAVSEIAVDIDGDLATASFKFINSVKPPPELNLEVDEKVLLLADNTAIFVREDGLWKLQWIELVHSLAYPGSIPGLDG
ncbi:MAG: hypothetical protein R6X02_33380 [Enhygromyxa sp.]